MATGTLKPLPAVAPVRTADDEPVIHLKVSTRPKSRGTYLDHEEKTARLTGDQITEFKAVARACDQDRKEPQSDPPYHRTTLIRRAVGLLLDNPHAIRGATVAEILQNLRVVSV